MKRCLTSLVIKEMKIRNIMRSHFTPARMAINKTMTSVGDVVEKQEPSFTAEGKVDWYSYYGKQSGSSSKNLEYSYCMTQQSLSWASTQNI